MAFPDWIIFSSVSISVALAMLSVRACSGTQTEILEGLGFNLTDTPVIGMHLSATDLVTEFSEIGAGIASGKHSLHREIVEINGKFIGLLQNMSKSYLSNSASKKVKQRCNLKRRCWTLSTILKPQTW